MPTIDISAKEEPDYVKKTDLLSLKKMVIEEIVSEFELKGQGNRATIGRPGYVDPFSRLEQSYKE
jgi:hypothetical protein